MTNGNVAPTSPSTRERFIAATLELIAEEGGSLEVNLRQISRRVGCAHTNAYNYFDRYEDLRWAAFRRALRIYAAAITRGLDRAMTPDVYLDRTIANLAAFPREQPGLFRFIGSDPIDPGTVPRDILETVSTMKGWVVDVFEAAAGPAADAAEARAAADIVLAYIDGETLNLINGRSIPGEDLEGRVVANALRLFALLTGRRPARRRAPELPDPARILGT